MYRLIPFVNTAFNIYTWLIIIRVILSWVPHDSYKPVFRFIYEMTEPVLAPFRKLLGGRMMIDFSPIIAFCALEFVRMCIITLLSYL